MAIHTIKYEYDDGVKLKNPIMWCGVEAKNNAFHFLDAQHLALSVGGSQQPCKNCVRSIINQLSKEL